MTWAESLGGIFSQWSKIDCQNALPEVAERNSFEKPKVSETGMKPLIWVNSPFCSKAVTLPRRVLSILEHSPDNSEATEMTIL